MTESRNKMISSIEATITSNEPIPLAQVRSWLASYASGIGKPMMRERLRHPMVRICSVKFPQQAGTGRVVDQHLAWAAGTCHADIR